jgi:serine/threonine-protein kinase
MTPSTIAHYRITAKLGEGGMGEVWRATDTKLNREVAIKILPDAFAQDADRMARFQREAQVLASLNHPNIAAIYGVEDRALVMELVEGETLHGPMPLDEALAVARQLAEALEYAHERGIIHRDLKPANIKITPEGRAKVLDFGLAKAMSTDAAPADPHSSPTLTMRATMAGVILGTAAYMSPEQARGQDADRRADIWSFGVVLYEMLTGRQLFTGATVSDTLAAVLRAEPDLSEVPEPVRGVVERSLRKGVRRRWQSIGDVRIALDEAPEHAPEEPRRSVLPWVVAAAVLAVIAVAGWLVVWRATRPVDHPLIRLSVDLGPDALSGANVTVVISRDGRRLVFPVRGPNGKQMLATRLLDQTHHTLMTGTEGGSDPFFSPDGRWVGFFAGGKLKKISVEGGAAVALCPASSPRGASWGEDGNIILSANFATSLSRVPDTGGIPQPLTGLRSGDAIFHMWPQMLPGGEAVLFTAAQTYTGQDNASVEVISLKTGQVKVVQRGGYYGRYLPSGHLVYVHQGVLFGVRFDTSRLEVRGTPTRLLDDLAANVLSGGGQFDFSEAPAGTGSFLYLSGKPSDQRWRVSWLDSSGKLEPLIPTPGLYGVPQFSPDGRRLAFGALGTIGIYDRDREAMSVVAVPGVTPAWAPDGKHIAFSRYSKIGTDLFWMRSDAAGEPERLLETQGIAFVRSFSPDGHWLVFQSSENGVHIWILPLDTRQPEHPKAGSPQPFLRTAANDSSPIFSPDGRWIAYRSDESGAEEIYVRPFPNSKGAKWKISADGGLFALWSNNRRELFYETLDYRIMVVDYTLEGASFVPGKPRLWSEKQLFYAGAMNLAIAPDGKRFAVLVPPESDASVHIAFLLNFFDDLKRRMP